MEEQTNFSEDLRRYLGVAWHWAWLLVLAAALAGGAAYWYSAQAVPMYEAVSTALVNEAPASIYTDYTSIYISQQLAATYSQMMTMDPVLDAVQEQLGLDSMPTVITVSPVKDSQILTVKVQDTDPVRAADVANTLPLVFAEQNRSSQEQRFAASKENLKAQLDTINAQIEDTITDLAALPPEPTADPETNQIAVDPNQAKRDTLEMTLLQYRQNYAGLLQTYEEIRLAEAQSMSNISVIEPAHIPTTPFSPQPLRNAALGAVVGLMLAAGIVFLFEAMDETIKTPEEISIKLGLPVLGLIATHRMSNKLITSEDPRSPVAEAFRSLRTNIAYASVDKPIKTLLITSPSPEDGKSTVAANLGVVIAQSGSMVAVVDADLRRPRVHQKLGLDNLSGITDLFMQPEIILNGEVQPTEVPNLVGIASGRLPPNPSELIGSAKMNDILQALSKMVEIAILDTPPLLAVTDAAALAPKVDGVVLVIKPGVTKLSATKQAIMQLNRVGAHILGVILNDVNLKRSGYRYTYYRHYYSNYGKYYGDEKRSRKHKKASEIPEPSAGQQS